MSVLAQVGGVVGVPGSPCSSSPVASTSGSRASLAWAPASAALAAVSRARRLSSPHRRRGRRRRAIAVAGAFVLDALARTLAFANLACVPVRMPITSGSEKANLLVPLYGVARLARAGAGLAAGARRQAARGSSAPSPFPSRRSCVDRAHAALDGRPPRGRDRRRAPSCSRSACSPSVSPGCRGAGWLTWMWAGLVATALALCGDRRVPVVDARGVLEPEGRRRERLRTVLPRQLRLLGSVDLRPLSRDRDPRQRSRACSSGCRRPQALGARRGHRRDVDRPLPLVLADELRRALRRRRRRCDGRVGPSGARGRRLRSPSSSQSATAATPQVRNG